MTHPRIIQLNTRREKLREELRGLKFDAEADASAADAEGIAFCESEIAKCTATIEKIEQLLEAERVESAAAWAARGGQPFRPECDFLGGTGRQQSAMTPAPAESAGALWARAKFGISARQHASDFESLKDFVEAVQSGADGRIFAGHLGQEGSRGGFLIPEQHLIEAIGPMYEASVALQHCDVFAMTGSELKIAGWDTSSASDDQLFGGFQAETVGEAETINEQRGLVRAVKLVANKLAILSAASNELIDDSRPAANMLASGMGTAIGWLIDRHVIRGDGVAKPLGILNSDSRVVQSKEGGQAAVSLVAENFARMFSRLHPSLYPTARWLVHPSCIPWIESLALVVGTGGSDWAGRVRFERGQYSIMGLPVSVTEKCSSIGTEGDVILTSLSEYAIGMRKEVSVETSRHVRFASDETAFRAIARLDGRAKWNAPYTPANGDTLSWCVTLETRE